MTTVEQGSPAAPGRICVGVLARCALLGALLAPLLVGCRPRPRLTVTFIGHSSFLLSGAEGIVLIDPGVGLSEAMRQRLVNKHPPFTDLDLILVTHPHRDHFDLLLVDSLLQLHPDAAFASTRAAVVALGGQNPAWVGSARLQPLSPVPHGSVSIVVNGISLEALDLPQDKPGANLGLIVTLSERRLLHSGDVALPHHLADHDLRAAQLDVAFVPYQFLLPERLAPGLLAALHEALEMEKTALVPMHFAPNGEREDFLSQMLIEEWRAGHVFRAPLEQWQVR